MPRSLTSVPNDSAEARAWRIPSSANALEFNADGALVATSRSVARTAWVLVASLLTGCLIVAVGIIGGRWPVAVVGAAVVVIAGILAVVLPRAGLSAPISMGVQYPSHTVGPRGDDGAHNTPIDTHPGERHSG